VPAHHAVVPSKQGLGRDHEDRPLGPGEEAAEDCKQRAVLGLEPRAWVLAAQDCQLVTEDQNLDLFGVRRPPAEHHQLKQAAQRKADERPDHPHLQQDDSTRRRTIALLITRPLTCGTDFWHPTGVAVLGVTALPVTAGIAVLKYRLYEIDRIINRTLVYGLLTALLAAVYAGLVLVLGQLSGGIGTELPSWAVAGATLAVAALFQPARRRIQQAVDRRFNRRKYDAAKTVEAFSVRLRDQIDLDTLATELQAVVDQTMEPTRVSLWLQPSAHGSSGTPGSEARPTPWAY
jgi:hypothetical protein